MKLKLNELPMPLRLILLLVGLFMLAVAIMFQANAGLGYTPWTVLADGIGKIIGSTMGKGEIAVSCMIIIIDIIAKERLGLGTVLNVFLVGTFIDMVTAMNFIPTPETFAMRIAFLFIGTTILAFGCLLYIGVGFGAGPRDSMMVVIMRITGRSMMVCRLCIEITVCLAGYLLGGTVGVGTIILAIITGPMISTIFKMFGVDAKKIPHLCFYPFGINKTSV